MCVRTLSQIYTLCPFGELVYVHSNQWSLSMRILLIRVGRLHPHGSSTRMHIIAVLPTMVHMTAAEIGMVKIFQQLVPSPFGRYENVLEINFLRPNSVRFNGRLCRAEWDADYEWDVVDIAFSYAGCEQTAHRPWRREKYTRIGPVFWICEQELRNRIFCTC